jgi:hypothetical protein
MPPAPGGIYQPLDYLDHLLISFRGKWVPDAGRKISLSFRRKDLNFTFEIKKKKSRAALPRVFKVHSYLLLKCFFDQSASEIQFRRQLR